MRRRHCRGRATAGDRRPSPCGRWGRRRRSRSRRSRFPPPQPPLRDGGAAPRQRPADAARGRLRRHRRRRPMGSTRGRCWWWSTRRSRSWWSLRASRCRTTTTASAPRATRAWRAGRGRRRWGHRVRRAGSWRWAARRRRWAQRWQRKQRRTPRRSRGRQPPGDRSRLPAGPGRLADGVHLASELRRSRGGVLPTQDARQGSATVGPCSAQAGGPANGASPSVCTRAHVRGRVVAGQATMEETAHGRR
jgi:hypothetical protein